MVDKTPNSAQVVSASLTINAGADRIFALLQDPTKHALFDGSETVQSARPSAPQRLELGSRFTMSMRMGVPYLMANTVVEFQQDVLIAWQHFGGHRWRYELDAKGPTTTYVTESFDWSTARLPWIYERIGAVDRNLRSIEATLPRLAGIVEA